MFVLRWLRKISRDLTGKSPSLNSIRLLSTMTSKASSSFLPSVRLNLLLFLSRTDVEQYISVMTSPSLLPLSSMQKRLIAPPSSVSLLLLFLLRLCDGSDGDGGVRDESPADADPLPPSCVRVCEECVVPSLLIQQERRCWQGGFARCLPLHLKWK